MTKRSTLGEDLPNALKASPSSLGTLARCARLWYQQKILELDETFTPAQLRSFARGTKLHDAIERFLLDPSCEAPDDELAALATTFLEKLRLAPGLTVEQQIHFEMEGVLVRGFIDAYTDRGILDHKTSSNVLRYGETEYTLAKNLQLMVYAHWWLTYHRPEADQLTIGHLQFQTRGKPFWRFVWSTVPRSHVEHYVEHTLRPLLRLQATVASAGGLDEVTATRTACGDYGGCPFAANCAKADAALATVSDLPP